MNILLLTLFLPLAGFVALLFLPRRSRSGWPVALISSLATFVSSLGLIGPAFSLPAQQTSVVDTMWVTSLNIHLRLGQWS